MGGGVLELENPGRRWVLDLGNLGIWEGEDPSAWKSRQEVVSSCLANSVGGGGWGLKNACHLSGCVYFFLE